MEEKLKQHKSKIIKIAFFGPESTGKTTLSKQLADYYATEWVPEFARDYLQEKWEENGHICVADDLLPIAYGQVQLENEKLKTANKYLFCDTNLMVTKVFSDLYYGFCDPILHDAALSHEYQMTFLTDIDVPWEKDDIRDKDDGREQAFEFFKKTLVENKIPFILLTGDQDTRFKKAISILEELERASTLGFSTTEYVQIYNHGIPFSKIEKQLEIYKNGISKVNLSRHAGLNDGILNFSEDDFGKMAHHFDNQKDKLQLMKFVPASGAATRMFNFILSFLNDFDIEKESINAYINRTNNTQLALFIVAKEKFPFYKEVELYLRKKYSNFNLLSKDYRNYYFIKAIIESETFDFANKPKAVLPFHEYETHISCAIEEHLQECVRYANSNNQSDLHFTVSEKHLSLFKEKEQEIKAKIEAENQIKITVDYSFQHKSTDSISVDLANEPYRNENNELFFRPGGHGALIENMNLLDADIVFVKNIDNVVTNDVQSAAMYKKALAGILIALQEKVFSYLKILTDNHLSESDIPEIVAFLKDKLYKNVSPNFEDLTLDEKTKALYHILNRPIRVCGMVKNEGEPGGGPFWVKNNQGELSLQIVETSQIDLENASQAAILKQATHFNPVDLVCGIKNFEDEKFDLTQFVDENTGFIVNKSVNGNNVKSYELPGLWNGAMANWLTIFVAVPLDTFNPVKTVNDLLKSAHQP